MFSTQLASNDSEEDNSGFVLLQEASRCVSACSVPNEAFGEVIKFVTRLVNCDSARLYLLQENELCLRASKDFRSGAIERVSLKAGPTGTAWVTRTREPIAIAERALEDVRFKLFNRPPEDDFEAFLLIPVIGGGNFLGLLNVQNVTRHKYSSNEINVIETMAFLLGARIEAARLKSENTFLSERIGTRDLIDRAKKILQQDLAISENSAYRMIQLESQHKNKRMNQIAEAIIMTDELKRISKEKPVVAHLIPKSISSTFGNGFESSRSKT